MNTPIPQTTPIPFSTKPYIKEVGIKKIEIIQNGELFDITKYYAKTWVDRQGEPFKYEFQGEYSDYLNPGKIVITR